MYHFDVYIFRAYCVKKKSLGLEESEAKARPIRLTKLFDDSKKKLVSLPGFRRKTFPSHSIVSYYLGFFVA